MLGLGLGIWLPAMGGGFSPRSLFAASEPGVWLDPSDLSTLFRDDAGTTPVTGAGQSVGRILDKSGRGNHATQPTAASRPIYGVHPSSGIRNRADGSATSTDAVAWPTSTTRNGITATKVGTGLDVDGLPYVDLRYQGTATGAIHETAYRSAGMNIPATVGQTLTVSYFARRVAGTLNGVQGMKAAVQEYSAAPLTFIASTVSTGTGTADADTLLSVSGTVSSGAFMRPLVQLNFTSGQVIDVTFRVKALQAEFASERSAYQFNYSQHNVVEAPFSQVHYLAFDGVDDFLITPTITPGTDKVQVFAGIRKLSDAARTTLVELGDGATIAGSFNIEAPGVATTPTYRFKSEGSTASFAGSPSSFAAPVTNVLTGIGDISGDLATLRVNGSQAAQSTADQGAGNFLAYPLYIGRRGGTTLPFNGRLYGLITRFGPNLTADQISQTERWMA